MPWIMQKGISNALIIGQAPAQHDDPSQPITGRTGRKLASLMDMSFEEYQCTFDRANLLDEWPGRRNMGVGDAFPLEEVRRSAYSLWSTYLGVTSCQYDWVLLLGRAVENAFGGRKPMPWMKWELIMPQAMKVAVLPHPSGVNRWWNETANKRAAKRFLRDWRVQVEGQKTEANVLDRGFTR